MPLIASHHASKIEVSFSIASLGDMFEIELIRTDLATEFESYTLAERARSSYRNHRTSHYLAKLDNLQIAFVSLSPSHDKRELCIFEIFVDPPHRRQGFGARIVQLCIEFARSADFETVCLLPIPGDSSISEAELKAWYIRSGFIPSKDQVDLLEISL
jgi:GNAT superfamily N-acetyltransferase